MGRSSNRFRRFRSRFAHHLETAFLAKDGAMLGPVFLVLSVSNTALSVLLALDLLDVPLVTFDLGATHFPTPTLLGAILISALGATYYAHQSGRRVRARDNAEWPGDELL